jgi:hypothetical protein
MNVPVRPIVMVPAPAPAPVPQITVNIPQPQVVYLTPPPVPVPVAPPVKPVVRHAARRKPVDPCYATIQECVVIGHRQTTDNKGDK